MKIATWNVNSVRQRIGHLQEWLKQHQPDVLCLQEIKCMDEAFPTEEIEAVGYNIATHGQKTFNGVALLSRYPLEDVRRGLPGDETDEQARYIEAVISVNNQAVRVASLYCPNGNPLGTEKFSYKLRWMERLTSHVQHLLTYEEVLVLLGDYNIIPEQEDAKNPEAWLNDALFQPESRAAWRKLLNLGLTDAIRMTDTSAGLYTFWDYQAGAWQRNNGIRIDHILLSPLAADRFKASGIDKAPRALEKPSDHVPVWVELSPTK